MRKLKITKRDLEYGWDYNIIKNDPRSGVQFKIATIASKEDAVLFTVADAMKALIEKMYALGWPPYGNRYIGALIDEANGLLGHIDDMNKKELS